MKNKPALIRDVGKNLSHNGSIMSPRNFSTRPLYRVARMKRTTTDSDFTNIMAIFLIEESAGRGAMSL